MLAFGHRLLRPAVCVTVTLWTMAATACNVPVFRYALERWEADHYEIVVFHRQRVWNTGASRNAWMRMSFSVAGWR